MNAGNPYKSDEVFLAKLKESQGPVEKVAAWLVRTGMNATVCPMVIRPNVAVREQYMDDFDIHVLLNGITKKIDVKGNPKISFTRGTWPWKTIIAQSVYDTDRKGFPWRVFQVNKELTWAIVINTEKTKAYWFRCHVFNKEINQKVWYWKIPVMHTKYIDLAI